jgi:hypothetical protein
LVDTVPIRVEIQALFVLQGILFQEQPSLAVAPVVAHSTVPEDVPIVEAGGVTA